MKKFILTTAIMFLAVANLAHADRVGNGGAGVYEGEDYKTFASAGFFVEPIYMDDQDLPELPKLRSKIKEMGFNEQTRASLLSDLVPTFNRRFLKVDASRFNRETYETIKEEYRKIFRDDRINIAIFAITDTEKKITYILPEFYQLNPIQRLTILFHETLWLMRPTAAYKEIALIDVYMQKYLTSPSTQTLFKFLSAFDQFINSSNESEDYLFSESRTNLNFNLLAFALKKDKESGALSSLMKAGRMRAVDFLGSKALACYQNANDNKECFDLMKGNFLDLSEKYPKSLLIRALLNSSPQMSTLRFNYEFRGNFPSFIGLNSNTPIIFEKDLLAKGLIGALVNLKWTDRKCGDTLFGRSCDEEQKSVRKEVPLFRMGSAIVTEPRSLTGPRN